MSILHKCQQSPYIYIYKFKVYYDTRICNIAMSKDNKMVDAIANKWL